MKIVLLTQDDPFYLPESNDNFLNKLKELTEHELVSVIVSDASPFGKKESFFKKVRKTYSIFGLRFFIYYTFKYILRRIILRKSVLKVVQKHRVPLWILTESINSSASLDKLKKLAPDLIIIIAGNQIIKKEVLDLPKYGVINAHSSLLPAFKGLLPTFWVLKSNQKITGVTVYKLGLGIDDGPILNSQEILITEEMTHADLVKKAKYVANDLLIQAIDIVKNPENFRNNEGGSYYKFPTRSDVKEFYKIRKKFY